MKSKQLLVLSLSSLMILASCTGGGRSSLSSENESNNSQSSITSSESSDDSSSSNEQVVPTAALTEEMLASFKLGYSVHFEQKTEYDSDSYSASIRYLAAKGNDKNYDVEYYSSSSSTLYNFNKKEKHYHYQPKPGEETEMLYDAGLSVGNKVIYDPVMGKDKYTNEDVAMTWAESYYSNVFQDFEVSYFARVGTENKFTLSFPAGTSSDVKDTIYSKLAAQLYGNLDVLESTTVDSFFLLTNGDKITGYELAFKTYTSSSSILRTSNGYFLSSGADAVSSVTPLEGNLDSDFENAMAKLKRHNYHLAETQSQYDIQTSAWKSLGSYAADFYNGESVVYDYYSSDNSKYMSYGYKTYTGNDYEGDYRTGIVPIKGQYYEDYTYQGSMEEFLPSFDISSILFVKDSASTSSKLIYKINEDIVISTKNNDLVFTPFDADGYYDRLVYLTITIEDDKINIHNETSLDGGLIIDVTYTDIGNVQNLVSSDKYHTSMEGLTWSDLISNNEANAESIIKTFTKDILDSIPVVNYSPNIYTETSKTSTMLYELIYDEDDGKELLANYGESLVAANFNKVTSDSGDVYKKNVTLSTRQYSLNVAPCFVWNKVLERGQLQITLSFSAAA